MEGEICRQQETSWPTLHLEHTLKKPVSCVHASDTAEIKVAAAILSPAFIDVVAWGFAS